MGLARAQNPSEVSAGRLVRDFRPSGFFVLRTPLVPVAEFSSWGRRVAGSDPSAGAGTPELVRDQLSQRLASLLSEPSIVDAMRVASPTLVDQIPGWLERKESRRKDRMQRALVQYFARMCDRCTPFGLFAGVSLGHVGTQTRLRLAGRERYRRRSTLDLAQTSRLLQSLVEDRTVLLGLRYRPNDTLAVVEGGYQYMEVHRIGDQERQEIAFLERDEALKVVLDCVSRGATLAELRIALMGGTSDPEVGESDIAEYLDDLIQAQVIEPDLVPAVVGKDPLDQILDSLNAIEPRPTATKRVRQLRQELGLLDAHGVGAPAEAYESVRSVWSNQFGMEPTNRLLQVDMFKEAADLRLSEEVVEEVLRGADLLWQLAGPMPDELRDFRNRFQERFESRVVPLAEVFDPERGLGSLGPDFKPRMAGAPLLAGLKLGAPDPDDHRAGRGSSDALANSLLRLLSGPNTVLDLTDELVRRITPREPAEPPDALSIHFDLVADSEEAVCQGRYQILYHGAMGPSGARMLGRFCDLDTGLLQAVRRHLEEEEALWPDEIFAEVVHSPEGRIGNVARRPHVRRVELSYVGHSRQTSDLRLTVDDLLLSLEGGRFVLRSRRDGRRVRPRLTSAHNFRRSSGIYRFLCALQHDGVRPGVGWNWGSLSGLDFLPRVERGRAVYSLARWKVGRDRPAYIKLAEAKAASVREESLRELIDELDLPQFVRLADGENRLLLDLSNPLCLSILADRASRRAALTLEETLQADLKGCVSGPEGKYRNEIILPLVRKKPNAPTEHIARTKRSRRTSTVQRVFTPGQEWLFFKLYAPTGTTHRLLQEVVHPLAALHQDIAPDQPWFYVRYSDPDHHLRVRFRADPAARRKLEELFASLIVPFVEVGSVARVNIDTYVREVERYGGRRGIELAEMWFRQDSVAALRLMSLAASDDRLQWTAVAMGWDRLLADFGLEYKQRERVVVVAREAFGREFHVGPAVRRRLAKRLRTERRELEALVTRTFPGESRLDEIDRVFRERSESTTELVREFRQLDEGGTLLCSIQDLLRSMMHMSANRMFASAARAQELVIHDFLARTYRSLTARTG